MKGNKIHIVWGLVVIVALVGGFFAGKGMAAGVNAGARNGAFGTSTRPGSFGGARGAGGSGAGGFTAGTVMSIDSQSITLQLMNGNSENVFYSSSTQIIVPQPASISSIKAGNTIMVGGTPNSDGSVTATTIQVRNGMGGGAGGPSGTGAPRQAGQ
jgi:hypothetical protein